ncbi:hypothetical protein AB0A74_03180 [Saccharothrix sp. NPDC042600]|uniref:hypothetical protein n=1 Tax=Saccharothrix TaxID=2071 RepID=UPI0034087292|nr:hypothetical protein GCM10017745_67800 [Saccharothrix mutabilis subsp. capreolus]
MAGFDFGAFDGFDGAGVPAPPSALLIGDPSTVELWVAHHYFTEGVRHAGLVAREMVMSSLVGLDYDPLRAVAGFVADDWIRRVYAEGLCEQLAEYAAKVRGSIAMADLALPSPEFGESSEVPQWLTREQSLRVAGRLEDLSGHLALRAGIGEPWRLHVVGWMPKTEPAPDLAVKGKAARPAVQRMRAVSLSRSSGHQRRVDPPGPVAGSQVRITVFKGAGR